MEFLIVTGLSGAGKSQVVNSLEDIGFYCADNMPPSLMLKFYELCAQAELEKVAVVTDTRGRDLFNQLSGELKILKDEKKGFHILFIDCSDSVIINRFKETRRKHPLADKYTSIQNAVSAERDLLAPMSERADYLIDTTQLTNAQLKERINQLFSGENSSSMVVNIVSFGFKYGPHSEADLMFDVRCFPNPYYDPNLRQLTGRDKAVSDFVLKSEEVQIFLDKLYSMVDFMLPLYAKEGKSEVVIAIGCTGGKHRSVTIAEQLAKHLKGKDSRVVITHRDIGKIRT